MENNTLKQLDNFRKFMTPKAYEDVFQRIKKAKDVLNSPEPEVGQTPKEVIWSKNKTKLYRYISDTPKKHNVPLLMIYAMINKPYVLDMTKGASMVEYLVERGFDVYLLDWGTPGWEDRKMKLEDYILDYIPRAVRKVLRTSQAEELSILGYCMGGVMTSVFAALNPDLPIRNLVFMTSPFDFAETGMYGRMLDERYFELDKLVDTLGLIPPEMIDLGNKMIDPIPTTLGPYKSLVERADNERFVTNFKVLQHWLNDGIPFPGESYRQWIRDFYQHNSLIKGELVMRGHRVDLKNIKANVLNLSGEKDQIAMPHMVEALMGAISSEDKTYINLPVGHTSITYGSQASKITYPTIGDWLAERSNVEAKQEEEEI